MLSNLNSDDLLKKCNSSADKNILFYVAGFIARSVSKESNCSECKDLCVSQENQLQIDFLEMNNCEEDEAHTRKYLLEQVNRGGLCTPTELIYRSCPYNWNFYRTLRLVLRVHSWTKCTNHGTAKQLMSSTWQLHLWLKGNYQVKF